ncbi:hypothetical protein [Parvularcula oceani]|uniref:hypothetical protein n=1 Tax=Parvularcula oceani TaxID=1247963 RepID=UPI0004E17FB5|nr:hypothetical protein [Parvularcula oceani]
MLRDRLELRRLVGTVLGEGVHAVLLALGLMTALAFALTGFDALATARFVHNALGRVIEAEPTRQARFGLAFALALSASVLIILAVRLIDCQAEKGRAA